MRGHPHYLERSLVPVAALLFHSCSGYPHLCLRLPLFPLFLLMDPGAVVQHCPSAAHATTCACFLAGHLDVTLHSYTGRHAVTLPACAGHSAVRCLRILYIHSEHMHSPRMVYRHSVFIHVDTRYAHTHTPVSHHLQLVWRVSRQCPHLSMTTHCRRVGQNLVCSPGYEPHISCRPLPYPHPTRPPLPPLVWEQHLPHPTNPACSTFSLLHLAPPPPTTASLCMQACGRPLG